MSNNVNNDTVDGFKGVRKIDTFPEILGSAPKRPPVKLDPNKIARTLVKNSTAEEVTSKKRLIDFFLTPEIKKFIATVGITITLTGGALGLIESQTKDTREALKVCRESASWVLKNRGIINIDESTGEKTITELNNFKDLVLDSPMDYFLYTYAMEDATNYTNDEMYNIRNKVAQCVLQANGMDRCISIRQLCNYFGYQNENELINAAIATLTNAYTNNELDGYLIEELSSRGGPKK